MRCGAVSAPPPCVPVMKCVGEVGGWCALGTSLQVHVVAGGTGPRSLHPDLAAGPASRFLSLSWLRGWYANSEKCPRRFQFISLCAASWNSAFSRGAAKPCTFYSLNLACLPDFVFLKVFFLKCNVLVFTEIMCFCHQSCKLIWNLTFKETEMIYL